MQNLKRAVTGIHNKVSQKGNIYATVIVIFSYHFLFDKDFQQRCKGQQSYCLTYMILPVVFIPVLLLWMDSHFQRTWKFTLATCTRKCCCCRCNCHFRWVLCVHIAKALMVALLWPVAALLDVDWYVCCYCVLHQEEKGCLHNVTEEKQNELKTESKVRVYLVLMSWKTVQYVYAFSDVVVFLLSPPSLSYLLLCTTVLSCFG